MEPMIDLCRTPMTPKAAAAAFQAVALHALTTACKRWGCWPNRTSGACNRCGYIGERTNDEIDRMPA